MKINIPIDKNEVASKRALQQAKSFESDKKENEHIKYIEHTDVRQVYSRLNHQVELALKAVDDSLENKRNILRKKYLEDESCLTYEYVEKAQKHAEKLNEEKRQRAEAILARQEKERQQYAKEMYEQLKVMNCDVLRAMATRERRKMLQTAHKLQILEKQQLKDKQRELDLMYHDIYVTDKLCDMDAMKFRKRFMDRLQIDDYLRKQMLGRKLADDEMKTLKKEEKQCLEKLAKTLDEEKQLENQRKYKRKQNLRELLVNQIEVNNDFKQRRKSWEDEMDRIFIENLQKESQEVKQQEFLNKQQTAQELRDYVRVWTEFNEFNKELRNKEDQQLSDIRMEKLENIKLFKMEQDEARRKLAKETMSYWNEQVLEKQERKRCEKDLSLAEREMYESCNVDLDKVRALQKRDYDKQVESDVKQQMGYRTLLNKRERDERIKSELKLIEEEEAKYAECLTKDINMNKMYHPFYRELFLKNSQFALKLQ